MLYPNIYGYIKWGMIRNTPKRAPGRKRVKGNGMLFKFPKDLEKYLRSESESSGKTMVRIIEELLRYRSQFKTWPPVGI